MNVGNRVRVVNPHHDRLNEDGFVRSIGIDSMFPIQVEFEDAALRVFKEEELELVQDELPLRYDVTKAVPKQLLLEHKPQGGFIVKDSGKRQQFDSGMVRDVQEGKLRPDLVKDGPMYLRWIVHLTKGAEKYTARNWMQADGEKERQRFLESADRHYLAWYMWRMYGLNVEDPANVTREPLREDHASALFFNVNGVEFLEEKKGATK